MIKLQEISNYLGTLDNTPRSSDKVHNNAAINFMAEFRETVLQDPCSPNIAIKDSTLDLSPAKSTEKPRPASYRFSRLAVAASFMLVALFGLGAARREFALKERRQLMPINSRLMELTHSVEDNFDSINEIENLLTDLDSSEAIFSENVIYWKTIRIGLSSMLAIEQAKRGKFTQAHEIAQNTLREAEQCPTTTPLLIPVHSLTHFSLARVLFDQARREIGEPRSSGFASALDECDSALAWAKEEKNSIGERYGLISWKIYTSRIKALRAAILHKSLRIAEANAVYNSIATELNAIPESHRPSNWTNLMCRICADWGLTLVTLQEEEQAVATYQLGLTHATTLPRRQSLWLAGLLQSNLADAYAEMSRTQLEIEARNKAIDLLMTSKRELGSIFSIDENLVLNYTRLACAFLREHKFSEATSTSQRLHALTLLTSTHVICTASDKAKISLLLSRDLSLSSQDRVELEKLSVKFLQQAKNEQDAWTTGQRSSDHEIWRKLVHTLPKLPAEIAAQLESLGI